MTTNIDKKGFWCQPSLRGLAYLAGANFLARVIVFLDYLINSLFTYEMVLLYSAHLDTETLLFFRAVFMIPVSLLGLLIFFGVEKESFNLVLYPTLMLLFLLVLRYGSEVALLIIHWEDHSVSRGPSLLFYLGVDMVSIVFLLLYVYFSLAAPERPQGIMMTPSRLNSLRRKLQRLHFKNNNYFEVEEMDVEGMRRMGKRKPPPPPPGEEEGNSPTPEPPPRPPPSPKFDYKARRAVATPPRPQNQVKEETVVVEQVQQEREKKQKPEQEREYTQKQEPERESLCKPQLTEQEPEKKQQVDSFETQTLKIYDEEPKRRSLLIETDLDKGGTLERKRKQKEEEEKLKKERIDPAEPEINKEKQNENHQDESLDQEEAPVNSSAEPQPEPEPEQDTEVTVVLKLPRSRKKSTMEAETEREQGEELSLSTYKTTAV